MFEPDGLEPDGSGTEHPDGDDGSAQDRGASPREHGRRALKATARTVLVLASVAALAVTAAGWTALDHLQRNVNTSDVLGRFPGAPLPDDRATDILLVGSDSRTDAQGDPLPPEVLKTLRTEATTGLNTDTLVLVRVPDDGSRATAVSIPRDTYTAVPGREPKKINSVYGLTKAATEDRLRRSGVTDSGEIRRKSKLAGQRALVRTVQALTGVHVDHYAEVNLLGFYEVTKAIGGVEVCLRNATSDKDSGADFPAGRQTISGADALAFVRQRHGLPRGGLDRIVRQQVFMAAVARKVLSTGTLTSPEKLNDLVAAARKSVVLDQDWDIMGFVRRMQSLASGNVRFVTMPIADATARSPRGRSIVRVDPAQVEAFFADLARGDGQPRRKSPDPERTGTPSGGPTDRLAPEPALVLDGSVGAQSAPEESGSGERGPITADGIPCVN